MNSKEPLCDDCILTDLRGHDYTDSVNFWRADPENRGDVKRIRAHASGELILEALQLPRPARCFRLRQILPDIEPTARNTHTFADCAEVQLMGMIAPKRVPGKQAAEVDIL